MYRVNKKCKNIYFKIFILFYFITSCQTNSIDKEELERENKKADSISIKLNSPELKDINKQLLENPDQPALYNKRALVYLKIKYMKFKLLLIILFVSFKKVHFTIVNGLVI